MRFQVEQRLPSEYPSEGKKHALMAARREAGNKLYDILMTQKLPAVVDIREITGKDRDGFYRETDIFRIEIDTYAVNHHHVTIAHMDELTELTLSIAPTKNVFKKAIRKVLASLSKVAR